MSTESTIPWTPEAADIEWMHQLVDSLNNGGLWVVPATGACYQIDKTDKKLILVSPPEEDDHLHSRIVLVSKLIGYDVEVRLQPKPTPTVEDYLL
jgi:hypothetical protein